MKFNGILIVAVIVALALGYWFFKEDSPNRVADTQNLEATRETQTPAPVPQLDNQPVEGTSADVQHSKSDTLSPVAEFRPLAESMPTLDDVKAELQKNVHETPPSIVNFSLVIGKKMDAAIESKEKSTQLFGELKECINDANETKPLPAKSLCFVNASRLAKRHSGLQQSFSELKSSVPQSVQGLEQLLENSSPQ